MERGSWAKSTPCHYTIWLRERGREGIALPPLVVTSVNNFQDPISNFGVVLGAVSKRAMGGLGLGSGNTLADQVGHPRNPASDLGGPSITPLPPEFITSELIPQPDRSFFKEKRKTLTFL